MNIYKSLFKIVLSFKSSAHFSDHAFVFATLFPVRPKLGLHSFHVSHEILKQDCFDKTTYKILLFKSKFLKKFARLFQEVLLDNYRARISSEETAWEYTGTGPGVRKGCNLYW